MTTPVWNHSSEAAEAVSAGAGKIPRPTAAAAASTTALAVITDGSCRP